MQDFTVPPHPQSTQTTPEPTSSGLQRTDALDAQPIEDFSYYPLAFISCALPYQDPRKRQDLLTPTDAFSWSRHDGALSMSLDAGSYIDGDGTKKFHLPYGLYPRVLLMWLTTSALKHQSRTFPLPTSARGLLSELNISWNPARARDVITQLRALLATQCVVTHRERRGQNFVDISEERFTIGTKARLRFSTDADLEDFDPHQPSQVEISEQFYQHITSGYIAPVVITRWQALISQGGSPLAADLFLWLTTRAPQIRTDTRVSWANLQSQLGSVVSPGRERDFAATVTRALGKVATIYPEMNFTIAGAGARSGFRGVILHPSPDADLLGLNPRLAYDAIAQAQEAVEKSGLTAPSEVHRDVNLQKLRGELLYHGLEVAESVTDTVLRAAIDVVLDRAKTTPGNPQAFVRVCILREPALLTGAPAPVAPVQVPAAPATPGQGVAPLVSGRPVLPVAPCPVHEQDVTGLVCRDCAVELKIVDTDPVTVAECWSAVRARLIELSHLEGVDTSGEWLRYSALAAARGARD